MADTENSTVTSLTVELLSAYLIKNTVAPEDLAELIRSTRSVLNETGAPVETAPEPEVHTPAVSVRKSLANREHILSLIDGKPYKTLKRHLKSHGLTPEAYRERYALPATYPMVAPAFGDKRRAIAQAIGLGSRTKPIPAQPVVTEPVAKPTATKPAATKPAAAKSSAEPASRATRSKAASASAPAAPATPDAAAPKAAGTKKPSSAKRVGKKASAQTTTAAMPAATKPVPAKAAAATGTKPDKAEAAAPENVAPAKAQTAAAQTVEPQTAKPQTSKPKRTKLKLAIPAAEPAKPVADTPEA